ncbi:MAG TPA: DEAD/DEAH box helicase [Acidimicrobiales bacterium]|nr:DEAD/DEAH box helicase [Acidimicrobiales bacterium]
MITDFAALGVPTAVAASLAERGITEAFPIQSLALPPAMSGQDVCGKAPTGSGKTLAFGIPLAQRVEQAKPRRPRALVLAPTRELAEQIHDELRPLLAPRKRRVATFYGGVGFGAQLNALRRGVDVAVACPGRLLDLVGQGEFILDDVDIVVLDEADRMADMGFLPDVRKILDKVRPNRQTLLFSATLDGDIDVLVRHYQKNPVRCAIEADPTDGAATTHHFIDMRAEDRVKQAASLISKHGSTIVFCRTKHGSDRVARQLKKAGVEAVAIHGGRSQNQRQRALDTFSAGRAEALVATDVAARGIHVDDVGLVLHFDVAGDHKDYTHRSGRTGRAGADGVVVSFLIAKDADKTRKLLRALDVDIIKSMPTGDGVRPSRPRPERTEPRERDGHRSHSGKKPHRKGASSSNGGPRPGGGKKKRHRKGPSGSNGGGGRSTSGQARNSGGNKHRGAQQSSNRSSSRSPRP